MCGGDEMMRSGALVCIMCGRSREQRPPTSLELEYTRPRNQPRKGGKVDS